MPGAKREQQCLDAMWERVHPLLPPRRAQPKGGRPFTDDKLCFAGIVFMLRNNLRWNALPAGSPSDSTCWRRHPSWSKTGVWDAVRRVVLVELEEAGLLDTSELFMDATFAEARKGGPASAPRNAASA